MKFDFSGRFGFLAAEVAKLYGEQFDARARERIGLSRAQCRLLAVLATNGDAQAPSQAELAQRLDLTPMAVATLCDRMQAAGWIRRAPSAGDRRVNEIHLQPPALDALEAALQIGDRLSAQALAALTLPERRQLVALLAKARAGLLATAAGAAEP